MGNAVNRLGDFDPARFTILAFCGACGRSGAIDRNAVSEDVTIPGLIQHLHCKECGSGDCSIRIVYTGVGGFSCNA